MGSSNELSENQEKTLSREEIRQKRLAEKQEEKRRRLAEKKADRLKKRHEREERKKNRNSKKNEANVASKESNPTFDTKDERRLAREEEKRKKAAEKEQRRLAREEEKRRKAAEKEQKKLARQEKKRKKLAEKEENRLVPDEGNVAALNVKDEKKLSREEKKRMRAAEKEQKRLAKEEEKRRKAAEKEQKRLAKKKESEATLIDEDTLTRREENRQKRAERKEEELAKDTNIKRKVAERSGRELIEGEGMSYLDHEGGYPSLIGIACPRCGSTDFKIGGTKGSTGKSLGVNLMFGAVGNMIASSAAKTNFEVKELNFKCNDCKNSFSSIPNSAPDDDILDEPCTITVKRLSRFYGAAIRHQIFLNGIKVGTIKNNEEVSFNTYTKTNILFIADQHGVTVGSDQVEFTAESGGNKRIEYKGKVKMLY